MTPISFTSSIYLVVFFYWDSYQLVGYDFIQNEEQHTFQRWTQSAMLTPVISWCNIMFLIMCTALVSSALSAHTRIVLVQRTYLCLTPAFFSARFNHLLSLTAVVGWLTHSSYSAREILLHFNVVRLCSTRYVYVRNLHVGQYFTVYTSCYFIGNKR